MTIFIEMGPLGMARRQLRAGRMLDMAVRAVRMGRSRFELFFENSPVLGLSSPKLGLLWGHVGREGPNRDCFSGMASEQVQ